MRKINVKKLLIIYSAIVLALGIFASSTLLYSGKDANAASGWNRIMANGSCDENTCTCPIQNVNGCKVDLHSCPDGLINDRCYNFVGTRANLNPGESVSVDSILSGMRCTYVQIDVNNPGEPSTWGYIGAVTLEWDDWSVCGEQPPPPPPPEPPPPPPPPPDDKEECPYNSTQARVRLSATAGWSSSLEVDCGNSFLVGSFHNNDLNNFANDTVIRVISPEDQNSILGNNAVYQTSAFGTYDVTVVTMKPNSDRWYPDAECIATAQVICTQDVPERGFTIRKVATNDDGPYDIGDVVNFRVEIVNTGDETLTSIAYRDVFDNSFLSYVSVLAVSPAHPGGFNMTPYLARSVNGNITTLSNPDITAQLGDLAPGKLMYFDYTFVARSASNRACNDVFAKPEGMSEKQARDCVGIIISTDL